MKNVATFILIAAVGFIGYRYWSEHHQQPAIVVVTPPPVPEPTPVGPRLAPEGTFFLLDYYGVQTDHGVTGWTPGQQVKAVVGKESEIGKLWVTDGKLQAQLDEAFLTRDIDLATRLSSTDRATQADATRQASLARDQQMAAEKRERADASKADARTSQPRTRTVYVAAPTPTNPLDRESKPTNGGRQVSRAPHIPGTIYQTPYPPR